MSLWWTSLIGKQTEWSVPMIKFTRFSYLRIHLGERPTASLLRVHRNTMSVEEQLFLRFSPRVEMYEDQDSFSANLSSTDVDLCVSLYSLYSSSLFSLTRSWNYPAELYREVVWCLPITLHPTIQSHSIKPHLWNFSLWIRIQTLFIPREGSSHGATARRLYVQMDESITSAISVSVIWSAGRRRRRWHALANMDLMTTFWASVSWPTCDGASANLAGEQRLLHNFPPDSHTVDVLKA